MVRGGRDGTWAHDGEAASGNQRGSRRLIIKAKTTAAQHMATGATHQGHSDNRGNRRGRMKEREGRSGGLRA